MLWFLIPIIMWLLILVALVPNKGFYKSAADRLMRGKLRDDRNALQIMLNHLVNKPEDWSIANDAASFPKESKAKQIYLSHNGQHWEYSFASGDKSRVLDGFYGAQFEHVLKKENDRRNSEMLMRHLYGVEGPLRLK